MNLGISKKVIFFSFLLINFIQPSKSADIERIQNNESYLPTKLSWSKIPEPNIESNISNFSIENYFGLISLDKNLLKHNENPLLAILRDESKEIIIQSDKQSELNNVIYAEGNVSVSYKGKLLKADNLTYDRLNNKISAKGNIELILGDQIFKVSL